MKVLLDTHAILWWLIDDKRLSRPARAIIENSSHVRLVSYASMWETAIKMSGGKLAVKDLTFPEIPNLLREFEFQFLPIRLRDLEQLQFLPRHHRDPFDRLLIAQCIAEGVPLMTSDSWVEDYEIETVW